MSDRKQFVEVDGAHSSTKSTDIGVVQGSLLGVIIFQLFINDLPKCLTYSMSILYADDTTLYIIGRSLKFLRQKMQSDLNSLSEWLSVNTLKLNVKKTKILLFNKDGLFPSIDLGINGESIETVTNFKFLGVHIDSCLSFMTHYSVLHTNLLKSTYIIRSLSKVLPLYVLCPLYFAYYRSGTVNSKSFVGKVLLRIKRKFELTVHFKHEMIEKLFTETS